MAAPVLSVQASGLGTPDERRALLARLEALGVDTYFVADHPGVGASPFPALAAAAPLTSSLRLGTYVANAGLRHPVDLAVDAATLDQLSEGRALLGVGAGHTPAEWAAVGRPYPTPGERVARLREVLAVLGPLLAGEAVTFAGEHLRLDGARLEVPRPVQEALPLLVGGGGHVVHELAGRHADVAGLTGMGRTLPDGHRHAVRWSGPAIDAQVEAVERGAAAAGRARPELEALVQVVQVTDDRERAAAALAEQVPDLTVDDALTCPFLLLGTPAELADHLGAVGARWGITRFTVRPDGLDALEALRPLLAGR